MNQVTQIFHTVLQYHKSLILATVLSLIRVSVYAQPEPEYRLKADYLHNFTQFIQWPSSAFNGSMDPMVIGVLGINPFGSYLRNIFAGDQVNGHYVIVKNYSDLSEIRKCHILFISKEDTTDMNQLFAYARAHNVLLVSDGSSQFLDEGGMIRFVTRNNKIQFQINLAAIKAANLTISSKMLRLAELVIDN